MNYFDFSKAVEVLCDELLIGCNSTVMFDETLDALKLLGDGRRWDIFRAPRNYSSERIYCTISKH